MRLDLASESEKLFSFESWRDPRQKQHEELSLTFNLKGRFMLAVVCLILSSIPEKALEAKEITFEPGSLGGVVRRNPVSFFSRFSFKFVRFEPYTNIVLEGLYKSTITSEKGFLGYIEEWGLLGQKHELVELFNEFSLNEV